MCTIAEQAALLQREWQTDPRWAGITRDYTARDVIRLRGCVAGEHGLARRGANRLWDLLHRQDALPALGVVADDDAVQAARAGWPAIYLPGRPAAEGTQAGGGHRSQSSHPVNPMPHRVRRMNDALLRATQPAAAEGSGDGVARERRLAAVVADAEAGLGAGLDAFELMTAMIEAGAAGVRFEDRLSPGNARGHRSGEVLVPTGQHIERLTAARLAADVLAVPSLVIARSAARTASLLTSDVDDRDHEFLTGDRTPEGFHRVEPGLYAHVTRGLAFAPYADLLWLETPAPDLAVARAFADIIRSQFPDKLLAYSCLRPSGWRAHPADPSVAQFQRELAAMGYHFQSALPGAHTAPAGSTSEPADRYPHEAAPAYA